MKALFANLTAQEFSVSSTRKSFNAQEEARLYALASQVWDAVHYEEPRNDRQIELLLLEMQQIRDRKVKSRRNA